MAKKKIYHIDNWNDLIKLVNDTNPNTETLVLCGYYNKPFRDKLFIDKLLFKKMPVQVIAYKRPKK